MVEVATIDPAMISSRACCVTTLCVTRQRGSGVKTPRALATVGMYSKRKAARGHRCKSEFSSTTSNVKVRLPTTDYRLFYGIKDSSQRLLVALIVEVNCGILSRL